MFAKSFSRALALLTVVPSASFALGLGDLHLQSSLNAPLDAEIELVDVTPEELQSLKASIASRDTFARYGLDWPVFLSGVQVRTQRGPDGKDIIKLKSTDAITEPFITLLVEVNWARGRLVREYTMLLDPPVYTPGQGASSAPVAAPNAGAGAHEGSIIRPQQPTPVNPDTAQSPAAAATAAAAGATASTSHRARSVPAPSPAADSADTAAAAGGSHVVKRGETLSSIAASTGGAGANTAQTHSWMLAIYQANPAAFDKNMNLLRSGAVLRIPESSAASSISPSEANGEIRRQYAAWRSNAPAGAATANEPGRLRLVTPSDTAAAGAGSGGDTQALQGRIKDLEGQLSDSKRLLELRNAELARLQSQVAGAKAPPAAPPAATPAPTPAPAATPPVAAAPTPAPTPPAASPPGEQKPAQAEATATPPVAQETPAAQEPAAAEADKTRVRRPHPAATPAAAESGSILDTLKDYWWALGLLVLGALAFLGVRAWRSRRQSEFDDSLGRLAVAGANSIDRSASGDTAPVRPLPNAEAFVVEESGTHERPRFGGAASASPAARHVSTDETISSETAINLDQGDPLAEADFHMAYGLYDQAADLIRIAISREPGRRDLKLKLLEVFFVWGNKEQFLQSARELADSRDEAAPGEWEKIVIMGKQLAPDDALFSGGSAVSGATAGGVDLDLEGGESRVDFDLMGEPVPGHAAGDVDLDIGSALGSSESAEGHTGNTDRNLNLNDEFEGVAHGGTTRQSTQRIPRDEPVMPEYGAESEGPTVEQPAISSPEKTAQQKVAMALKQGNTGEQTEELAIDDLGLDLGALDTVDQPNLAASSEAPTMVAGMDERSRRVMEEAQRRAASEDQDTAATAAFRMDETELQTVFGKANGMGGESAQYAESAQYDVSSTARLKSLSGRDVDFDLGEVEMDADGGHRRVANGGSIDLDVGTASMPEGTGTYTSTQKLPSDDLALPDLEPVTMSEVGTKLDLARAYMDMGDPEGARNILDEVLHEGSVAQKQEAQRLIESLPG
jgi:pilus assembly protein FimV